jgi:hypothetical protein
MWHIFQHTEGKLKGKFDFAFISKSRYISGSNPQGYSRKAGCIKSLRLMMKQMHSELIEIQDDTKYPPVVFILSMKGALVKAGVKPDKPYIPNKK